MTLTFTIPGRPTAWQRGGINTGHRALVFTKRESVSYQGIVREAARAAGAHTPSDEPFGLVITIDVRRPKAHLNSKGLVKPGAPSACSKRPDLDNVAKQVADALNGVVWHDDSQVCWLTVARQWGEQDSVRVAVHGVPAAKLVACQ